MGSTKLCTNRILDQNFGMCFTNVHGTNYLRPWNWSPECANKDFGSTIENVKDKFKIVLDVQHFLPNEVSVKVTDREIIIEGHHEERRDDHGSIARQFLRRYTLPRDCLPDTVTSTISTDGVLTIMASKAKDIKVNEKTVPIKICGPCLRTEETTPDLAKQNVTKSVYTNGKSLLKTEMDKAALKDEHSRLLKPDLFKDAISTTEKLISESRKETDELLKLISPTTTATEQCISATSDKLEEVLGQCKTAITELKGKISESSMNEKIEETASMKSYVSEKYESVETSHSTSTTSTMSMSMASTEKTSEVLCAQLKEAAEL